MSLVSLFMEIADSSRGSIAQDRRVADVCHVLSGYAPRGARAAPSGGYHHCGLFPVTDVRRRARYEVPAGRAKRVRSPDPVLYMT